MGVNAHLETVERMAYLLHSNESSFKKRVAEAKQVIQKTVSDSMVCVSWGKDSVVLLHLAQTINPHIPVVHVGDTYRDELDNFSQVENTYINCFGITEYHHLLVDIGEDSVTKAINKTELPYTTRILGLRVQEQGGRVYSLKKYGKVHQYQTGKSAGEWRVCPLLNWSHQDIWGYIFSNNLPYLNFYNCYGSEARTSSVYSERLFAKKTNHGGVNAGRVARLKEYSPKFYNRVVEKSEALGAMV